jgi:hypothetical protein
MKKSPWSPPRIWTARSTRRTRPRRSRASCSSARRERRCPWSGGLPPVLAPDRPGLHQSRRHAQDPGYDLGELAPVLLEATPSTKNVGAVTPARLPPRHPPPPASGMGDHLKPAFSWPSSGAAPRRADRGEMPPGRPGAGVRPPESLARRAREPVARRPRMKPGSGKWPDKPQLAEGSSRIDGARRSNRGSRSRCID